MIGEVACFAAPEAPGTPKKRVSGDCAAMALPGGGRGPGQTP